MPPKQTTKLIRAAKYLRISDDREGRELGITRQDQDLDALGERHGYTYVETYCDNDIGASTRSRKPRPEYKRMLKDARAGRFEVICAATSSRLTRRMREHEDHIELAEERGIRYDYWKSPSFDLNTSAGRRIARILAANDAGESEDIAERVQDARRQQAEQGRFGGGGLRRFGFEPDGVTVRRDEALAIISMADSVLVDVSNRAIARDLERTCVRSVTGVPWSAKAVRDILLRPRNAGLMVYRETTRERKVYTRENIVGVAPWAEVRCTCGHWPDTHEALTEHVRLANSAEHQACSILTVDQYWSVVAKLTAPERRTNFAGPEPKYLGSGIYRCPCGSALYALKRKDKYVCKHRFGDGPHVTIDITDMDECVQSVVVARLSRDDAADLINEPQSTGVDVPALHAEIQRLNEIMLADKRDCDNGLLPRPVMLDSMRRHTTTIEDLSRQLDDAMHASPLTALVGTDNVATAWDEIGLGHQRAILKALFRISVQPVGKGGRFARDEAGLVIRDEHGRARRVTPADRVTFEPATREDVADAAADAA